MRTLFFIGLSIFLISCVATTDPRKSQREQTSQLTDSEKEYISRIEKDGRLLYEKDTRAAKATDLLLLKVNPADYPNGVGWVTYPNQEDYTVSFYEKGAGSFSVIADIRFFRESPPAVIIEPNRVPSDMEVSMVNARLAALEKGRNCCSYRFNTVILPSEDEDYWDVYVLAATTNPNLIQVGGHVKVTVLKRTAEVLEVMPLSKTCLAMDKSKSGAREGASMVGFAVTHIVSPMPVAIYPYLSLLHGMNVLVSSERGCWIISKGRVKHSCR